MIEKNNDIERISDINKFININKKELIKLKVLYFNKNKKYKLIHSILNIDCLDSILNIGCVNHYSSKYDIKAKTIKMKIYPNSLVMARYYCPKLYWLSILLLANDNSIISYYLKGACFASLPGQYKDYFFSDWKEFNLLRGKCIERAIYYYEKLLHNYTDDDNILKNYIYNINIIIQRLADLYLASNKRKEALKYFKKCYNSTKWVHSAKKIAIIESNGNIEKELKLLYKFQKDILQDSKFSSEIEQIEKTINYIKNKIELKNQVFELMKQGEKQKDIIKELNIKQSNIREIIQLLCAEGKLKKEKNKYVVDKL